jgi:hypothetical protein
MKELNTTFIETLQNTDVGSLLAEYGEMALDSLTSNEALKEIPIVGSVLSLGKAGIAIKDYLYIKKLLAFLTESNLSDDERIEFGKKVQEIKDQKIGDRIIQAIDKLDDEVKARYVGKIFKRYALGKISADMLKRGIRAIELAYVDDLKIVALQPKDLERIEPSITDGLYSIGLLEIGIEVNDAQDNPTMVNSKKYKASQVGVVLANSLFDEAVIYLGAQGRGFMNTYITPFYDKPKSYYGN